MAKIHDKYVIELAEVIKGYGNDPDVEDPFELSLFYRFYELPNIAIQRENFLKMKPLEPQRIKGRWEIIEDWDGDDLYRCSECLSMFTLIDGTPEDNDYNFCPCCGARMEEEEDAVD